MERKELFCGECTNWNMQVKMHDGIRKTIEYFRKEIHDEEKKRRIDP